MDAKRRARRGAILLEVVMATGLLVVFAGAALLVSDTASRAFRSENTSIELLAQGRTALDQIQARLRAADADALTPPAVAAPFSTTQVTFQTVTGFENDLPVLGPEERLTFESDPGDPDDGVDNDGDGLIDEGRVAWIEKPGAAGERRRVLCSWVAENLEGEVPGNGLDDNGNGLIDEPGFCMSFDGSLATVHLTLMRLDRFGHPIEHTFTRTIALRDTGVTTP